MSSSGGGEGNDPATTAPGGATTMGTTAGRLPAGPPSISGFASAPPPPLIRHPVAGESLRHKADQGKPSSDEVMAKGWEEIIIPSFSIGQSGP